MVEPKVEAVEAALDGEKPVKHLIGCTRTIKTAVLVCEYLSQRCVGTSIGRESIHYVFKDPTPNNGYWSADIIVDSYNPAIDYKTISNMVEVCRAFVAGAGEIWT